MDIEQLDTLIRVLHAADIDNDDAADDADNLWTWALDEFLLRTGEPHELDPGEDDEGDDGEGDDADTSVIYVSSGGTAYPGRVFGQ